jgi:hypothetical protein
MSYSFCIVAVSVYSVWALGYLVPPGCYNIPLYHFGATLVCLVISTAMKEHEQHCICPDCAPWAFACSILFLLSVISAGVSLILMGLHAL